MFTSDGLFYAARGAADPPLLCLHGAGGSHQHWGRQLADLSNERRVLALDLPGHGRSQPPAPETIAGYVAAVLGLLDELGLARVALAGHSLGAAIALSLAIEQPARVAGLALVGGGPRLPVAPTLFAALSSDPQTTLGKIAARFYSRNAPPELRAAGIAAYQQADPVATLAAFQACAAFDLSGRPAAISVPTLVICGAQDALTPPELSRELAAAIPNAELQIIEGAGHAPMLEYPETVSALLRTWLSPLA